MPGHEPILLTDEQMRKFIAEGYLILQTDFPKAFHDRLNEQLNRVYEEEGNPGNNLLPRVREVQKIFDHPVVAGALTSVLGPGYMLHAHRHGHFNAVPKPGAWHKDSYWGYHRIRNHHPWWAMIMYFPQDTPPELGPTGVLPGTQHYESRTFETDDVEGEALASGKAGTFALIHYDIWHRSTPNVLGHPRYMLKFEFMRTTAPTAPTWDCKDEAWSLPAALQSPIARHPILWEETWNWLSGRPCSLAGTLPEDADAISRLTERLEDPFEPVALDAAYELGCRGAAGAQALLAALRHEQTSVSRLAAYGLSIAGTAAVDGLVAALGEERDAVVAHAAFALGELGRFAAGATPRIAALLDHPSAKVRRTAVDALGMIPDAGQAAVDGLIRGLRDEDVQVRFMSGLALARVGAAAKDAVPHLAAALDDDNRYVRAHAAEALRYIGTEEAKDLLIRELFNSRWCPTTTPASTFYP